MKTILCRILAALFLTPAALAAQPAPVDIQCIHYRNDYRRPWHCDPRPAPDAVIVVAPPSDIDRRPEPRNPKDLKDRHRRAPGAPVPR